MTQHFIVTTHQESARSAIRIRRKLIDISSYSDTLNHQGLLLMAAAKIKLTDLTTLGEAAECLRALAHPHRLRMVQMLLQGDYTVGDLAEACGLPSAMASEHLRLMQRCGFLKSEKEGRCVYYRVTEPHLKNILKCIEDRFGVGSVALSLPRQ
jgi:DNA-binding transcriptional ArsR family regulator